MSFYSDYEDDYYAYGPDDDDLWLPCDQSRDYDDYEYEPTDSEIFFEHIGYDEFDDGTLNAEPETPTEDEVGPLEALPTRGKISPAACLGYRVLRPGCSCCGGALGIRRAWRRARNSKPRRKDHHAENLSRSWENAMIGGYLFSDNYHYDGKSAAYLGRH